MLEHVSFISSTSGGSITNAFYTMRLYMGQPIPEILNDMYAMFQGDQLLEAAVQRLNDPETWREYPHKHRNLINAFAITYDQDLFGRKTLGEFWDAPDDRHIEEVAINSTELNNGISFRFKIQRGDPSVASFGNSYLRFKDNAFWAVKSLRISDIVAASSCFPLGFEPLVFPHDFAAASHTPAELMDAMNIRHNNPLDLQRVKKLPFGLIDGGVVDNQGIYSMALEDTERQRRAKEKLAESGTISATAAGGKPFSLQIIADVASYFLDPYTVPSDARPPVWKRIPLLTIVPAICAAFVMPFLATAIFALQKMPWYDFVLLLPGFALSGIIGWLAQKAWHALNHNPNDAPAKVLRRNWLKILWNPIGWWWDAIATRRASFSQLAESVFLKQIRRMHQTRAYEDEGNKNRLLGSYIYDLSIAQRQRRDHDLPLKDADWWPTYSTRLTPSVAMENVAERARNVGTTLWYGPKSAQESDVVTATGQFSICYNLIKYLNRLEVFQGKLSDELQALRTELLADWDRFQEDPQWLLARMQVPEA